MAENFQQQLERVTAKSRLVVEKYNVISHQKAELEAEVEQLRSKLASSEAEIDKLRVEVEYLKVATILSSKDDTKQVKDVISNLVREIDRCIADLID
jgi:chromosome segregation ATPase